MQKRGTIIQAFKPISKENIIKHKEEEEEQLGPFLDHYFMTI